MIDQRAIEISRQFDEVVAWAPEQIHAGRLRPLPQAPHGAFGKMYGLVVAWAGDDDDRHRGNSLEGEFSIRGDSVKKLPVPGPFGVTVA
ncbi:hypothetical protein GCM10009552_27030 [Rothia nasimurium]